MEERRRIFVLSALKPAAGADAYEHWARDRDIPHGLRLPSVDAFEIFRVVSTLKGGVSSYDYVEVVDVSDLDRFVDERKAAMMDIDREFDAWVQDAVYLVSSPIAARSNHGS